MVVPGTRVRRINAEEILTGQDEVFSWYASEEAPGVFRPTGAHFRCRDTRVHERYTERPRQNGAGRLRTVG